MGCTVVVTRDGRTCERVEVSALVERLVVGRADECDIQLDSKAVSRQHCQLVRRGDVHLVQDLGSNNGTFVNGRRIKEHALSDGDAITVGEFTLRYAAERIEDDAPRVMPGVDDGFDLTYDVRPRPAAAAAPLGPAPRAIARPVAHLEVEAPGEPRTVIVRQAVFLIGAGPAADLRLEGRRDPPLVAMIVRDGPRFLAVDLSPRRDLLQVEGAPAREARLEDGQALEVCGARLRFRRGLPRLAPGGRVEISDRPAAPSRPRSGT